MALDATVGGANSNSYSTEAEADAYMATRLHASVWSSATSADKVAVLIWATRLLDQLSWQGAKASEAQALRWPRSGVVDRDGYSVDDDIIPQDLKDACAEYALSLLSTDLTAAPDTAGFSKLKVGSIELEIDKFDREDGAPDSVLSLISYAVEGGGSSYFAPIVRT